MQKKSVFACLAGGAAVGAANGLLGGGGGMLAVPILEKAGLEERCAHATAIAVIAPASLVSGIVYLCSGLVEMPLFIMTHYPQRHSVKLYINLRPIRICRKI